MFGRLSVAAIDLSRNRRNSVCEEREMTVFQGADEWGAECSRAHFALPQITVINPSRNACHSERAILNVGRLDY